MDIAFLSAQQLESVVDLFCEMSVHHVAYRVNDVAAALEHLRAEGVRLIDDAPRDGSRNTLIAFVHPRSMEGVLVELVQTR